MTIYLMVKTHLKTGLKYLCKTTQNPFTYKGSGIYWRKHLKTHGSEHTTEIITECANQDELYYWGSHYSRLWNVVGAMDDFGNKIYANMIPETGGGGPPTEETRKKMRESRARQVFSKETNIKRSNSLKGKTLGIKRSPEAKAKMSALAKKRKHSPETIAKMSQTRKGRKMSEEHKAKIGAANKGKKKRQTPLL